MKYKGKTIKGPNEELVIIPRGNTDDFVFTCQAVMGYEVFDDLVEEPKPRMVLRKGEQVATPFLDDPEYLQAVREHDKKRLSWLICTSLSATEGLEFETVDMSDSTTWNNYYDELSDAGFTSTEIGRITRGVMIANSLDQKKIDEARAHFLAMQREAVVLPSSLLGEQKTTPSGELAKDSASVQTESKITGKTATSGLKLN